MLRTLGLALVLLSVSLSAPAGTWGTNPALPVQLTIGIQASLPPDFRVEVLGPTQKRLKEALPHARILYRNMPIEDLRREVAEGRIQAYFADAGLFGDLQAEGRSEQLAALRPAAALDPTYATGAAVVVPAESPLHAIKDLRGRRIASDRPDNFGTWIIFEGLLSQHELTAEDVRPVFTDFIAPSALVRLLKGEADAAVVSVCELEWAVKAGVIPKGRLRVMEEKPVRYSACTRTSALFPSVIFGAASSLGSSAAQALSITLLTAPPMPTGAVWALVTDFSSVKNLYRDLRRGPYQYLRDIDKPTFWEENRRLLLGSAALTALLLIFWSAYTAHVRRLVAQRTATLERAVREKTEAAERELRLREKLSLLERAGVVSELSSLFAHEVRQPVAALTAFAGAMKLYAAEHHPDDVMLTHTAKRIIDEASRVSDIVERVRGYAKGERHPRIAVSVVSLLKETVSAFRVCSASSGIRLDITADANLCVEAEPLEITLVMLNLLKNAAAAMTGSDEAVITITADACVREADNLGMARIRITDQGPRLSDEAFAMLTASSGPNASGKSDGLGLGLMLCRTILEAHGGEFFWRRPDAGPGLTAEIRLPRVNQADLEPQPNLIKTCHQF